MSENNENHADNDENMRPYKTSPEHLLSLLDGLGVAYELYHHEAVYSVEESHKVKSGLNGVHCRNLALVDKKKNMWLVTLRDETPMDLRKLEKVLGCSGRLSFMRPERLWEHLGVRPGSVTPFCIMNDADHAVTPVLEDEMMAAALMNVHPMINTMSIAFAPDGLRRFLAQTGYEATYFSASAVAPDA